MTSRCLEEILEARLQALQTPHRYFRAAVHRFLSYLHAEFPQVRQFSDLRRDPHLLGWARELGQQVPPLSNYSCRIYLTALRRLFREWAEKENQSAPLELILPEDFPGRPCVPRKPRPIRRTDRPSRSSRLPSAIGEIFETQIQTLTAILRPCMLQYYRVAARSFLSYLQQHFPEVQQLSALRRDPHVLGWLQVLYRLDRALSPGTRETYLYKLRRLFQEFAAAGHPVPLDLIRPEDFPRWAQQQLRRAGLRLPRLPFGDLFEARIQTLTTVLRPAP